MHGIRYSGGGETRTRFTVIGFPWDFGASLGRPGARYGPGAIRDACRWNLARIRDARIWDLEGGRVIDLSGLQLTDAGDVPIAAHDRAQTFQRARDMIAQAVRDGSVPIVLGGDHSISLPGIEALAKEAGRPVGIIQIDAHLDLVDDSPVQGRYSQSSQIRRALELEQVSPARLVQIGLRGFNYPEYAEYARSQGITQFSAPDVARLGAERVAQEALERAGKDGAAIYVTLDIDALDPSVAPGAGHLEFGGLSVQDVSTMLRLLAPKVAAFDIAEVNPVFDFQGMTANLAAKLLFDLVMTRVASDAA
ncbi:MAG: agmatinase family protein [Firmicutes bacterium]|nr:agmatinase family protein [Bacillota bacterium]